MTFRTVCFIIVIFGWASQSVGQQISPRKELESSIISALDPKKVIDFYETRQKLLTKNIPQIIFVPGILGSKIDECEIDNSQCVPIWGTNSVIGKRGIDLSIKPNKFYRTDVVEGLFFQDIYGNIIDHIRVEIRNANRSNEISQHLKVFHYDWRQSNLVTAKKLAQEICSIHSRNPGSPIFVIGHSMGGIAIKMWSHYFSHEICENGEIPLVRKIVFVASPHLGSVKAVKAFADGYNVLFNEIDKLSVGGFLSFLEQNFVLESVNQAGASFPSLYELLPIQSSESCRNIIPELSKLDNTIMNQKGEAENIFRISTWKKFDFLKRLGAAPVRAAFYDAKVKPMLENSENLLCDILNFNKQEFTEVSYIVGRQDETNTLSWFKLHESKNTPFIDYGFTYGDGTVSVESSKDHLYSRSVQIKEVKADHTSIISHSVLLQEIRKWMITAKLETDIQLASTNQLSREMLVKSIALTGELLPVNPDPDSWIKPEVKEVIAINTDVLKTMNYSTDEVAEFASKVFDHKKRASLYTVAAASGLDSENRDEWIVKAARDLYLAGDYGSALANSKYLINSDEEKTNTITIGTGIGQQAKNVMSWAALRLGNNETYAKLTGELIASGGNSIEPSSPVPSRVLFLGVPSNPNSTDQQAYSNYLPWKNDWKFQGLEIPEIRHSDIQQ